MENLVHAVVSSRLDYCNSLFLSEEFKKTLQLVQKTAALALTGTRRREDISPVSTSLHWLQNLESYS